PQYGYGGAFNPCIDCHRFMVRRAAEYMKEVGADFVFTGEVVGQRPMSQLKRCLPLIDKDTEIEGRLLRPLSAKLLDETIPEREGMVDRSRLLGLSGRSRKSQFDLAQKYGITGFSPPAGGCLLTEKPFGNRFKDFLDGICRDAKETSALCFGRYFRVDRKCAVIIGRDQEENASLEACAVRGDCIVELINVGAPLALVKGAEISEDVLQISAGISQYFSKAKGAPAEVASCRFIGEERRMNTTARKLSERDISAMWKQ
ncbi:MAG TPA: tRNA 4-thiouridine(8) synthase ThiI, partial [Candidatus Omnitrophota bacterium]|nr:tRNA 4-thiouridine(8) synthase ThiI [Candidatus Omnitrophota bacterium]